MHLGYAILHQRQVPVVVEQSGRGGGNVLGQPLAVAERREHVLPAVQQQDRNRDVGLAASSGDVARISSRSLSIFALAAPSSVRNRRVSSMLTWPMPAK